MALDFRADRVRTGRIIASGSTGFSARLVIYDTTAASDFSGNITSSQFNISSGIGTDTFLFVSGAIGGKGVASPRISSFGGDVSVSGAFYALNGLSGSLTKLADGTSYLRAGDNITIVSQSNGSIAISASAPAFSITSPSASIIYSPTANTQTGSSTLVFNDTDRIISLSGSSEAIYLGVPVTAPIPGSISASLGFAHNGAVVYRNKANSTWYRGLSGDSSLGLGDDSLILGDTTWKRIIGVVSNSVAFSLSSSFNFFSGTFQFPQGISGSLTKLTDGTSYLVAGTNITITSNSNGSVTIDAAGGGGSVQWQEGTPSPRIKTTASVAIAGADNVYAQQKSVGAFFFVSGGINNLPDNAGACSLFGGDVWMSGNLGLVTSQNGLSFVAFNQGGLAIASMSYNAAGGANPGVGNLYVSGVAKLGTFAATASAGAASASMIIGHAKAIWGEESTNVQRRLLVLTASNVIAVGDASSTVHLSSSLFDIYTNALRRVRVSNAGAISIGALTGIDSGIGGTLSMGNNSPIYMQDTSNNFRSIVTYDGNNIIRFGEQASNLNQIKFVGTTAGVYATLSRSYTLAMGDDEIGIVSIKPVGTVRAADQPNGSVTNIGGSSLVIRSGRGTGTGASSSITFQGTVEGSTGNTVHALRDVALMHGSYGFQLAGITSASLPAASALFSGSLQQTSDTGQLFFLSNSTWKDISKGVDKIMVAGALSTYATSSTRAMVGQFEFNPTEFANPPYGFIFKTVLSVVTGTNVTGSVSLYNLSSGSYVEIGGAGVTTLNVSSSTPMVLSSVNLRTALNFYATSSAIYEVRLHTSNLLSASTIGIAQMIIA